MNDVTEWRKSRTADRRPKQVGSDHPSSSSRGIVGGKFAALVKADPYDCMVQGMWRVSEG